MLPVSQQLMFRQIVKDSSSARQQFQMNQHYDVIAICAVTTSDTITQPFDSAYLLVLTLPTHLHPVAHQSMSLFCYFTQQQPWL